MSGLPAPPPPKTQPTHCREAAPNPPPPPSQQWDGTGPHPYRRTEKTRAIFPMARILFLMISLRTVVPP